MRARPWILALAVAVGACDPDDCTRLPTSFQLDLELEDKGPRTPAALLRVDVDTGAERRRRYFEVGASVQDGFTSLGVELDPAPTEESSVTVTVAASPTTSTATAPLGEVAERFELDPNGCNRFRLELEL